MSVAMSQLTLDLERRATILERESRALLMRGLLMLKRTRTGGSKK